MSGCTRCVDVVRRGCVVTGGGIADSLKVNLNSKDC